MKCRIEFNWNWSVPQLNYTDSLLFIGSCFSYSVGEKFKQDRLNASVNPLGTQYNPLSIVQNLNVFRGKLEVEEVDLVESQELWYYTHAHHDLFGSDPKQLLEKIKQIAQEEQKRWQAIKYVVITPGTAQYYTFLKTQRGVGNCHKLPAKMFKTNTLNQQEIHDTFSEIIKNEPQKHFIFTISPVRYLREGLVQSNINKSILRLAIHSLSEQYNNVHYFPSYEYLIDQLRDYRYYAEDMIHPSSVAVEYIYQSLLNHWACNKTQEYIKAWQPIKNRLAHKISPQTPSNFTQKTQELLHVFEQTWHNNLPK